MYAILLEVNTGWREDISDDLIEFYINKEKDYDSGTIPIGNISANTLTAMLRNTHNKYTPNNPSSPVYDYLKSNRKLIASVGYELDDGYIEWVEQGTFYSDDWTPTGITCIVKARDRAKFLLDINYRASTIYQNKRISDLVKQLVEDFGLSSDEYSIQDT